MIDTPEQEAPTPQPGSLEDTFMYHKPTDEAIPKYHELRQQALTFAKAIDRLCPAGPDRTAAIRLVREAVMTANASIALNGASYR
jgi:hypothetical protein